MGKVGGWVAGPLFGSRYVKKLDALLALVLAVYGAGDASGVIHTSHRHGGVGAALIVLAMTLPVAVRSSLPLVAVTMLAAGAILKDIAIAPLVVCGVTLPSLALVVFSVGSRLNRRPALLGAAVGVTSAVFQPFSDPQLKGFSIGASILILILWAAGRLVHSRDGMLARLRGQTDELRNQRDRTAAVAVAADRVRIAEELDGVLATRIGQLAGEAAAGRASLSADPDAAEAALSTIEHEGRRALADMRGIVGVLRVDAPVVPEPCLDDIRLLMDRLLGTQARLVISGERRRLGAGVELSGYRIIERLLEPLEGLPGAQAEVTLHFEPDALALTVHGRAPSDADLRAPLTAAREWVALHAGTLDTQTGSGFAHTDVRLPLVTAYA